MTLNGEPLMYIIYISFQLFICWLIRLVIYTLKDLLNMIWLSNILIMKVPDESLLPEINMIFIVKK